MAFILFQFLYDVVQRATANAFGADVESMAIDLFASPTSATPDPGKALK